MMKYIQNKIKFSQDSIKENFKDAKSLSSTINDLKIGKITAQDIPPIRIIEYKRDIYTLDNRRLVAFQDAGINIKYQKLGSIPSNEMFKFTTNINGDSIRIR